ncbi:MAG: uracil phosphoribosyltransferase [Melioribacteraceae bacterium]|nr:uracil phosphoribosyltransferase [Melioribacteraceae bacterium]MCF8263810.1 uracil phosphoribosyltransferase [Melioribacteraceae bacterium]MCF8412103.1 uracil phosphoribosyltransferase [Melioribacteraceae bacterium]
MNQIILLESAIIKQELTKLRDKNSSTATFRNSLTRIGYALAVECSKFLETTEFEIETPLEKTTGYKIAHEIVIFPILRAGLGFVDPFLQIYSDAKVGHIGLKRNESTLQPEEYYYNSPINLKEHEVIVVDPMLATGGSAVSAINNLKERGAKRIIFASLISAPEGLTFLSQSHPDITIITAAKDRQLNEKGYILPGLGDAGDRTFGTA